MSYKTRRSRRRRSKSPKRRKHRRSKSPKRLRHRHRRSKSPVKSVQHHSPKDTLKKINTTTRDITNTLNTALTLAGGPWPEFINYYGKYGKVLMEIKKRIKYFGDFANAVNTTSNFFKR